MKTFYSSLLASVLLVSSVTAQSLDVGFSGTRSATAPLNTVTGINTNVETNALANDWALTASGSYQLLAIPLVITAASAATQTTIANGALDFEFATAGLLSSVASLLPASNWGATKTYAASTLAAAGISSGDTFRYAFRADIDDGIFGAAGLGLSLFNNLNLTISQGGTNLFAGHLNSGILGVTSLVGSTGNYYIDLVGINPAQDLTIAWNASALADADLLAGLSGTPDYVYRIDNVSFTEITPVPEPGSLVLLAIGGVALMRRRRL